MENCLEKQELLRLQSTGQTVLVVDVRMPEEYQLQHIAEALNIPLDELNEYAKNLPVGSLIITVCGKGGGRSEIASAQLRESGLNSKFLCGGTFGWFE